jgi:TonB family protein
MLETLIDLLRQYAGPALAWWLPMQVQTAVFVLILLSLDRLLHQASPRLRYALWMTALFKAMLPPFFNLPVGDALMTQLETVVAVEVTPLMQLPISAGLTMEMLFFSIIVTASLLLAFVALWRSITMRHALTGARRFHVDELKLGCPVYVNERIPTPLAVGVFRPRIHITPEVAHGDRNMLAAVLYHEAMHVRRFDTLLVPLQTVLQVLYALNPMVWLLNMRLFRYREMICDADALHRSGAAPEQYGRLLLNYAQGQSAGMPRSGNCFFETRGGFTERVVQLFNLQQPTSMKWRHYLLLAAVSLAALPLSWRCSDTVLEGRPHAEQQPVSAAGMQGDELIDAQAEIIGGLEAIRARLIYPEAAVSDSAQGVVVVEVRVLSNGAIDDMTLARRVHPAIDAAALEAVGGLTFRPATQNGRPVASIVNIPIAFRLQ